MFNYQHLGETAVMALMVRNLLNSNDDMAGLDCFEEEQADEFYTF